MSGAIDLVKGIISGPDTPSVPEVADPVDLEAQAEAEAEEEARRLRKGKVQTVFTSGSGLQSQPAAAKTVLGG